MELSVVCPASKTFDVVAICEPVGTAYITFCGHVVAVFVNVHQLANLCPNLFVVRVCGNLLAERQPLPEGFPVTCFLFVSYHSVQFELVYFIRVNSVSAVAVMLVVVLSDVEQTKIFSVEEDMAGLGGLTVQIEAGTAENLVQSLVQEAGISVVAAVAYLKRLVLVVVLLACENRIIKRVFPFVYLAALQTERRFHRPAVAAAVSA